MAISTHFASGIAEWAQVKRPNKFNNWSINLYTDKATRKDIKSLGIRSNPKEGNDAYGDGWFITFRRPVSKTWKGTVTQLEPPQLLNADGTPFDGLIGNGSKVTVKFEVYDFNGGVDATGVKYDGGKAARLVAVRIDELVPYEPEAKEDAPAAKGPLEVPPF